MAATLLRYLSDEDAPGISRAKHGTSFNYFDAKGRKISDARTLERIRSIVIPPAWTDVWIAPTPHGHIQATGRDARGRKQYRYHTLWRAQRDQSKYAALESFARALPAIRRGVARDLKKPGLPREKVLAAIVRLLECSMIRVGNEEYTKSNGSYGLTTLLDNHVKFSGGKMRFAFRGKSGVKRNVELQDRRLASIVKQCQEIPGQVLFQYYGEDGRRRRVSSGDVNQYLRELSGQEFTAKCFRTWGGTLAVMGALAGKHAPSSEREAKKEIAEAIKATAERLGNTTTVCRKYYVHPAVLDAYQTSGISAAASREQLRSREKLLMNILKQHRSAGGRSPRRTSIRTAA